MKPVFEFVAASVLIIGLSNASAAPKHPGNGKNVTMRADGTSIVLNLTGDRGRQGADGKDGADGTACTDGDRGYDGERGGYGENGGNLTVFVSDLAKLKSIKVISLGGPGGFGGKGGRGGDEGRYQSCDESGFNCHWSSCGGNHAGGDGDRGPEGYDGDRGNLYLVTKVAEIPQERNAAYLILSDAIQVPTVLVENRWETHATGAKNLLAAGSDLSDEYYVFETSSYHTFKIIWAGDESLDNYKDENIEMTWAKGEPVIRFSNRRLGLLADLQTTESESIFTIRKIIREADMANLKTTGLVMGASGPEYVIADASAVSDLVKTEGRMTIDKSGFWSDKPVFEGKIPESALIISKNEIRVLLGQLDLDAKFLKPGTKLNFRPYLSRILGYGSQGWGDDIKLKIPKK